MNGSNLNVCDRSVAGERELLRPRLIMQAHGKNCERLVVITAGPGYGKTTLLSQLKKSFNGPAIYYELENGGHGFHLFIRRLILESCRLRPDPGVEIEEKAGAGLELRSGDVALSSIAFLEQLWGKASRPVAAFLDNFELVNENREVMACVRLLLDHLPCGSRLYVAGRSRSNLGIARLRAERDVIEVNQSDLKFGFEETAEFLGSAGLCWTEKEIMDWHKATDGWPAILEICRRELIVRDKTAVEILPGLIGRPGELNRYLAGIWQGLEERHRQFFIAASLIEPLEAQICARAGIGPESEAEALIKSAAASMGAVLNESGSSINPVMRRFLVYQLEQSSSGSEISQWHCKIAHAYAASGNRSRAVQHFIEAGDFDNAADIMETMAADLLEEENPEPVEEWLARIPAGKKLKRPWLCLSQAQTDFNRGDVCKSRELVDRAADKFRKTQNHYGLYCCALVISHMRAIAGHHLGSLEAAQEAQKWARKPAERAYALSRAAVQRQILGLRTGQGQGRGHSMALRHQSLGQARLKIMLSDLDLLFLKGDFGRLLTRTLELIIKTDVEALSLPYRFFLLSHLANAYYLSAKYEEAYPVVVRAAKLVHGSVYRPAIGLMEERILYYLGKGEGPANNEEAGKFDNTGIISPGRGRADHLGTRARRQGDFQKALRLHRQGLALCKIKEKRLSETAGMLANIGADKFRVAGGMGPGGEAEIMAASALARRYGYKYIECQVLFHLAWKAFQAGRKKQARRQIKAALGLAASLSHHHFIVQEGRISLELLAFAFECGIENDFLKVIFGLILRPLLRDDDARVRAAANKELAALGAAIADPLQLLTRRERQILSIIGAGLSNLEIAQKLSISEATVKRHVANIFLKLGLHKRRQAKEYFLSRRQKINDLVLT